MYYGYLSYTSQKLEVRRTFTKGSQKNDNTNEIYKTMIVNIPLPAFDIQIVKSNHNWYLKYNTSKNKIEKIVIDKPCDIEMICMNNNKLYVVVNEYSIKEYMDL